MNGEFEDVQKLIRLKRYEKPSPEYFDGFLDEFQRRQRSELLSRSAHSILFERVATYFSGMGRRRWVYAAGGAYAVVALGMYAWPDAKPETVAAGEVSEAPPSALWGGDAGKIDLTSHSSGGGTQVGEAVPLFPEPLAPFLRPSSVKIDYGSTPRRRRVVLPQRDNDFFVTGSVENAREF